LTFPRLAALRKRFVAQPPAHWLMAAYLKYKPPAAEVEPITFEAAVAAEGGAYRLPKRFFLKK
jgi:hypothetical protein